MEDFACSPIWTYAYDEEGDQGQDELTVRPFEGTLDELDMTGVAFAHFTLADGTQMNGYICPGAPADTGLERLPPVIITKAGQVGFWFGCVMPPSALIASSYDALQKRPDEAFPISFTLAVPSRYPLSGTIPGFLYFEDTPRDAIQLR